MDEPGFEDNIKDILARFEIISTFIFHEVRLFLF